MDMTSYLLGKKNGGVTPTGEVDINSNGVHNVSGYATANVQVPGPSGAINITENGTTDVTNYASANVSVPPNVQTKTTTITTNGTTTITPDQGYDGLSSVEVTTNVEPDLTPYFGDLKPASLNSISGLSQIIKAIPNLTVNSTSLFNAFYYCTSLTTIPLIDTSNVTVFDHTFYRCTSLTTIPLIDTSKGTDFTSTFQQCTSLTTIPQLDTSSATSMGSMFSGCTSLTTIPQLDTSSARILYYMFDGCTNLTTVPVLNLSSVTGSNYLTRMFSNCTNLSNDSLNNIMASLITATNYTGTKTLAQVGISSAQATTCMGLSNYSNFVSAGWTTGY